jgi:HupE/UreJ protein
MVYRPYAISHQPSAILALAAALLVVASSAGLRAHDIPNDVTIQTFVRPEGTRLRLLVRVPLQAMRDMDYPKPRDTARGDLMDLSRAEPTLRDASTLWISDFVDVFENGVRLGKPQVMAVRAALQSDRSFATYEEALAHVTGPPLPPDTEFVWSQGLLDVLFEYPIQSERSEFSIEPRLARLGIRTLTVVRFMPPGGAVRAFEFYGDPGFVRLDPSARQAAWQFVKLGFVHLLDGSGYLLFLGCLVIPFRRVRSLVAVVTAFVVAHSITLIASAYNLAPDALWFPPLIETLIAASIVYLALEDIVLAASTGTQTSQRWQRSRSSENEFFSSNSPTLVTAATEPVGSRGPQRRIFSAVSASSAASALRRRWLVTFGFGLAYGFAFSFALRQMLQFAGLHRLTSVLSFNVGIELGLLLVLVLLVPALNLVFRVLVSERLATIILAAIVGHTAWHWMGGTFAVLRQFRFEWPAIDAAFLASAMRWAMLAVIAVALYWLVFGVLRAARNDEPADDVFTHS